MVFVRSVLIKVKKISNVAKKCFSNTRVHAQKLCGVHPSGLILGLNVLEGDTKGQQIKFTQTGDKMNDRTQGKLMEILKNSALPPPKMGQAKMVYGLDQMFPAIAVCGLGSDCLSYNPVECIDERKEGIRMGVGAGIRLFQDHAFQTVYVDSCGHAESAAEGAALAVWAYQELRNHSNQIPVPDVSLFDSCDFAGWSMGLEKAAAQNLARQLQEKPRNLLTPSVFAQSSVEILSKCGVCTEVKMKNWAKLRNLNAFLTVAKGSCEPPVFLETLYEGCDPDICPIVMIGKGTTYNTGGLCTKEYDELQWMRGDLSGAACVIATIKAVAALQLPVNIRSLIPLCENSFGAAAYKPGDFCSSTNNKTILIQDTSNEGILMLADTINYAKEFNPKFILDIGTIAPAERVALASCASCVFSNSESLYETLRVASIHTGDRIWRFPLWDYFSQYIQSTCCSDLTNEKLPKNIGGVCKSAAFLHEFLPNNVDWIHIDNYGVATTTGKHFTYLREGMSGRPTRTLIEFIAQLACQVKVNTC